MSQFTKSILLLGILAGNMLYSFADRGLRKKSKNRVTLNIATNNSFKKSLSFNLKTGLKYKGMLFTGTQRENTSLVANSLLTYQKGNTVYIVPNKQKIVVPEIKQGYTGMKLIIKSKN
jgi:hypothetical protein